MQYIRNIIRKLIRESYFEESGFSRMMNTITGNVPEVEKFVIVTAANPSGQPMYPDDKQKSAEFNNRQMAKLYSIISSWKYGYVKIGGFYEFQEPSVLIGGMSKSEGRKLAQKFGQESFIFAHRENLDDENSVMIYELVGSDGRTFKKSELVIANNDVQKYTNFYSKVNGRKFQIPFYDEVFSNRRLVVGKGEPENIEPEYRDTKTFRQKQSLKGKDRKIAGVDFE